MSINEYSCFNDETLDPDLGHFKSILNYTVYNY